MEKLKCHTTLVCTDETKPSATEGKIYDAVKLDEDGEIVYMITNDMGQRHYFTKDGGYAGYENWFELIK